MRRRTDNLAFVKAFPKSRKTIRWATFYEASTTLLACCGVSLKTNCGVYCMPKRQPKNVIKFSSFRIPRKMICANRKWSTYPWLLMEEIRLMNIPLFTGFIHPRWFFGISSIPKHSMYGIFTYIYPKHQPNVGKYTLHWVYWIKSMSKVVCFRVLQFSTYFVTSGFVWSLQKNHICWLGLTKSSHQPFSL